MHDDLGIRLRRERVTIGDQLLAHLAIVLDDAVENDRDLARVAAYEWMRVLLGDCAVRRPARVTDAVTRRRPIRPGGIDEHLQLADSAHVVEAFLLAQRDARGVVAPVLEAAQPAE